MQKTILIFFIIFLISCKTTDKKQETNLEKPIVFEFVSFDYSITGNKKSTDENEFYAQDYEFKFLFINNDNNFLINYKIYDENDNLILERKKIKPVLESVKDKIFIVKDKFSKLFCYNKLKYNLSIDLNGEKKDFSGEYVNESTAFLANCEIGPVISQYIDDKINVSIHCNLLIKNCSNISWVHIIPPSKNFFWDLPMENTENGIQATGDIYMKDKKYIQNGGYILQVNLDKNGVIQKNFNISDIYNNDKGNNYGLPIASFIGEDSTNIRLDLISRDMIETMEIWLFLEIGGKLQKIGICKYPAFLEIINKNELKNMIYNDDGKKIKLMSNKEYICKIYLFGKEINGIKYVSISDPYKFKFKEYKFFIL